MLNLLLHHTKNSE